MSTQEPTWRLCPNTNGGTYYHACQCSDIEMGLFCLGVSGLIADCIEFAGHELSVISQDELEQAYKKYASEADVIRHLTEEDWRL